MPICEAGEEVARDLKTLIGLPLLAAVLFGVVSCAGSTQDDPTGRTWQLTELDGSPVLEGTIIDLTIDGDTVSGSAGCNAYNGAATVDEDGTMTLGPEFAVTFMACDPAVMDQEQEYLTSLSMVTSYEASEEELLLEDADGNVVAAFE